MKFMLLCYDDERYWEKAGKLVHKKALDEAVQLTHEMDAKNQYRLAAPLAPSATAKTVRVRDGNQSVTDGPFAETHEVLGGFYLIDVNSVDEAIEYASRHSGVKVGAVEVREVMEIPGLPIGK